MTPPAPREVQFARQNAGLSQSQAGQLVHLGGTGETGAALARNRWSEYERGIRTMDVARWELFLIKTGQHPTSSTINGMLVMPVFI